MQNINLSAAMTWHASDFIEGSLLWYAVVLMFTSTIFLTYPVA